MRRMSLTTAAVAAMIGSALPAAAQDAGSEAALPYVEAVRQSLEGRVEAQLAHEAIRAVPEAALGAFVAWFEPRAGDMPGDYLLDYAGRIFRAGSADAAVGWFLAGRTRLLYDALRCTDDTVIQRVAIADAVHEDIIAYIEANPERAADLGRQALGWELANPPPEDAGRLLDFCLTGSRGLKLAVEQGKIEEGEARRIGEAGDREVMIALPDIDDPDDWVRPSSEHAAAREQARAITERVIANLSGEPAPAGDPAGAGN